MRSPREGMKTGGPVTEPRGTLLSKGQGDDRSFNYIMCLGTILDNLDFQLLRNGDHKKLK